MNYEAAATYVNITREEFDSWASSEVKRWNIKRGTQGVYQLHLSDSVAIEVNSTLGSKGENMGRANASMSMKLVSTVTGQTLNRKAQGQKYFTRTQNWRANLSKGTGRMREAYRKASSFYEAVARIEDRDKYKAEVLAEIESVYGWSNIPVLKGFHAKVNNGGILTNPQRDDLARATSNVGTEAPDSAPAALQGPELTPEQEAFLGRLRALYQAARKDGDDWTMTFARDIGEKLKRGGYSLSSKQRELLVKKIRLYGV